MKRKKRINIANIEQQSSGYEPPDLEALNEIMKDNVVMVSYLEEPISSELYSSTEQLEKNNFEYGDSSSPEPFLENYSDIIIGLRKDDCSATPSFNEASEKVIQQSGFNTIPFHKFG